MESSQETASHDGVVSEVPTTAHKTARANILGEASDVEHAIEPNEHDSYGWRFWLIIASLCATSLLTAVEGTVTATALPTIARNLDSRELYVWFVNAIFLSR